jgi:uncharacterized protein involved in exopolysaccharide biosynthesis
LIILIFVITVGTVMLGTFLSKPIYQSSTKVILNREISESVMRLSLWIPFGRSFDLEEEINSEMELIRSRPVAEMVAARLEEMSEEEAAGQPVDSASVAEAQQEEDRLRRVLALQKAIGAEPVKKSDVIQITFRDGDPHRAMFLANMVAEAYIDYRARIYRSGEAVDFFDDQIEIAKHNLDQLESALKDYREQEAFLSYDKQEMILLNKLNEFEFSLTEVRKDIISIEAKLVKVREYMNSSLKPLVPSLEIREEPIISELHDQLIERRLRLNELLTRYTEDHREVQNLRSEITLGESDLRIEVGKLIDLQESSLSVLRAEEEALRSTVNMLYGEVKSLPEKELTVGQLQRAISNHQEVYSMLVLKREEARVAEASDRRIANVSVISPATLPSKPVSPKKVMALIVSSLIGLVGGFGLAFVLEYMDHSLRSAEDVEHYLNLPVLACIPETKRS